ncbi:MAG: sigma 54-dependent Fis family transcriptional regulator [Deltaproteobacteria bacterium]|nr:sigma 54-dependent Fis family transcriptional regulator [Deltaproteobacteria bacterium]
MDDVPRTRLQPRAVRMVHRLRVTVERGPDAGATCAPDDDAALAIGTSEDNALVLADPAVSRYHLELRRTASGVQLLDLGSRNGTWVNDLRIERAIVPAGTRFRIGDTTILVEDAGSTVAPPPGEAPRLPDLVGDSDAIREVARLIGKLARVDSSVLIQGETGVGKEVIARALHEASPRRAAELVVVDCGSMPATLIASILFGHEKGSFTGADQRRTGAFERARGGTVLLDEIGELPLEVQPALLGVLERRAFTRVGGSQSLSADVRVLAATHRDLRAEVNAGRFRADLYYRLAVARIVIPPLRERPEDIAPLVRHFVHKLTGVDELGPLAHALDALRAHPWSGNVRELRNVVEAAIVMGELDLGDGTSAAPRPPNPESPAATAVRGADAPSYRDARAAALHRFEAEYLRDLIARTGGNASEAARLARMDRPYLLTLLRKHGLRS